jgi:hypothetical protein
MRISENWLGGVAKQEEVRAGWFAGERMTQPQFYGSAVRSAAIVSPARPETIPV